MIQALKRFILKMVNRMGYDLVWKRPDQQNTFLGIHHYPIRTIIDIGANRGQFARIARAAFPEAILHCFEPLASPYHELTLWAKTQGGKVATYNLALGNRSGEVRMLSHPEHDDSSSLLATTELCAELYPFSREQAEVTVPQATLDEILGRRSSPLAAEILVKMDVQGYEDRVIEGGRGILGRARACILEICLDPLYETQASFAGIHRLMETLGYRYAGNLEQVYAADGHVIYLDCVFLRDANG